MLGTRSDLPHYERRSCHRSSSLLRLCARSTVDVSDVIGAELTTDPKLPESPGAVLSLAQAQVVPAIFGSLIASLTGTTTCARYENRNESEMQSVVRTFHENFTNSRKGLENRLQCGVYQSAALALQLVPQPMQIRF